MAYAGYGKLKVLIVDDFDNFRMTVSKMLQEFGVRDVDTVGNGQQALHQCKDNQYDLILCDYNLGKGKNGQQVLEDLRQRRLLGNQCLFVLVSAESSKNVVMAAYDCEPDDYLAKPVTTKALRQRLDRLLLRRAVLAPIHKAIDGGDLDTAIGLCQKEIKSDSRYAGACQKLLGRLYCERGDYDSAEMVYQKVLEQRSLDWALVGLAEVKKAQGDLLGAQQWLEEAVSTNPFYMKAYDLQVDILREQGSTERLQDVLQESAAASPLSILRQQQLADIAMANNDMITAASAYKRSVRLGEHSCFERGGDYLNLGRTAAGLWHQDRDKAKAISRDAVKALGEYDQRFGKSPEDKLQRMLVESQLYSGQGDTAKSEQLLAEAETLLQSEPISRVDTEIELVQAYHALGQKEKAQKLLRELVKRHEGDENQLQKLDHLLEVPASNKNRKLVAEINKKGIACYEAKEYVGAIEHFALALRKFPHHLGVRLNMAQAQIDQMEAQGITESTLAEASVTLDFVGKHIDARHEQLQRYRQLQDLLKQCERKGSA
ncbi:tetratricopeptide repeat-containing response regulator [Marinimicrobium sp. ABcell2]|uniref:tetratricopeptide repeat-containing response regulator n=1 Tax=Marinimicrobium sp. ABcell2 TaxID=3069751 RepID=UPI0027B37F43|nr:tetratricopeptide repeat-containing response regulator [Marinimicrobium sp. ABcell2]MDQ2075567.1 response regulator [Marinimicrobium sp. ABcell2]